MHVILGRKCLKTTLFGKLARAYPRCLSRSYVVYNSLSDLIVLSPIHNFPVIKSDVG